jgi:CubicO group peptidase (beta-lactamase class C family)
MRIAGVAVILTASVALSSAAQDAVDAYVKGQLEPRKLPGLSLAVVRNGRIVKAEGYGVASLELRVPATAQFVQLLAAHPLKFAPGDQWSYVNAFPLLGMVIERVTGAPFTTFVETRIFKALGLTSARFKRDGEVVADRADGYVINEGEWRHGEMLRPSVIAANGGVMMSVVDFARWDIAVTGGRLLRAESLRAMTTPVRLNNGRTVSHGLGWFMDQFNGHRFGAHWGTTVTGHSAVIRRYVDEGVTVIVLANLNDDGLAVDAISKQVANLYVPGVVIHGLRPAAAFELLGEEKVGASHFNLDPATVMLRRYRASTPAGYRYLTVRLSASGTILAF